jgi:hypothetical protein
MAATGGVITGYTITYGVAAGVGIGVGWRPVAAPGGGDASVVAAWDASYGPAIGAGPSKVFMCKGLQLVVLQLMLLPLLIIVPVWELRLLGLARTLLIVLVPVLVSTNMRLVVAFLYVLVGD